MCACVCVRDEIFRFVAQVVMERRYEWLLSLGTQTMEFSETDSWRFLLYFVWDFIFIINKINKIMANYALYTYLFLSFKFDRGRSTTWTQTISPHIVIRKCRGTSVSLNDVIRWFFCSSLSMWGGRAARLESSNWQRDGSRPWFFTFAR